MWVTRRTKDWAADSFFLPWCIEEPRQRSELMQSPCIIQTIHVSISFHGTDMNTLPLFSLLFFHSPVVTYQPTILKTIWEGNPTTPSAINTVGWMMLLARASFWILLEDTCSRWMQCQAFMIRSVRLVVSCVVGKITHTHIRAIECYLPPIYTYHWP